MKYVQINSHSGGWAEEVVFKYHRQLQDEGVDSYVFWGEGKPTVNDHEVLLNSKLGRSINAIITRIDGKIGFHSKRPTQKLIDRLNEIQPDVVHLHSPLGYYLNVEMFFNWLMKDDCRFIWTQHDCWAFTGYCRHFTFAKCSQWKTGCTQNCPCPKQSATLPDLGLKRSVVWSYEKKKKLFTMLPPERVTIVTPSEWLAGLVRQSYLGKYEVKVINNTINTEVFKPTENNLRQMWGIEDKFIVLGVSSHWEFRKGIQDFIRLLDDLGSGYAMVIVGLDEKQIKQIKESSKIPFIGVKRTSSRQELAEIYSVADVFFNPTLEENYPTVNLEAEACGTPVITYDTGGCRETIKNPRSKVVQNYDEGLREIRKHFELWHKENS